MAIFVSPDTGTRFQMGGGDSRHLVDPEIGASQITLNYSIFQPGHEFPQHFHDVSADIFIVLEGGVSVRQGDSYTPITEGDFAYIPPGEVHGTVNQSGKQAILISFQSPPDEALYRGERDPALTGTTPKPPENQVTTVQIRQLSTGQQTPADQVQRWTPVSPATGGKEMQLDYYELAPNGSINWPASTTAEAVYFIRLGDVSLATNGKTLTLARHQAAFIPLNEAQSLTNCGSTPAQIIRCQALAA